MPDADLAKYCTLAVERGVTAAKQIAPGSVITAPWVRLKCRFGCPVYNASHCCPPDTMTPEQTRTILDCYHRAILFHIEGSKAGGWKDRFRQLKVMLTDLEGEIFKDGHYKAFVYLSGRCQVCAECAKPKGYPCSFPARARPSMEASGIDVFQTVRNNGFEINTLRDKSETSNNFCLMLID